MKAVKAKNVKFEKENKQFIHSLIQYLCIYVIDTGPTLIAFFITDIN